MRRVSEERDFGAAKRGRSGGPAFSDEDEMEMLEFVKAHAVLYTKEHGQNQEGQTVGGDRRAGWKLRARCQTLVLQVLQAHFRPEELPDD